jgi:uncharacterized protein YciI
MISVEVLMKYVVYAHDYRTEDAVSRRLAVRQSHLDGVAVLRSRGQFHLGGALLDETGAMIGSMMLVEFSTVDDLQAWLDREPYIQEQVWERYEVTPFRQAEV